MKLSHFMDGWRGTQSENRFNRMLIAGLGLLVVLLTVGLVSKSTTVVMVPPTLEQEASLSENNASTEIQKSWGMYIATLLGNVSPGNASFLAKNISTHLSPHMYQPVVTSIQEQVKQIELEQLTTTFRATTVTWQQETGSVIVSGEAVTQGLRGEPQKAQRIYEMKFVTRNYQVLLDDIKVYRKGEAPQAVASTP